MTILYPLIYDDIADLAPLKVIGEWSSTSIVNAAMGGYLSAASRFDAPDDKSLLRLVDLLSKRLDVKDYMGRLAWQGMVTEIEIHRDRYTFAYALDEVANAVKVTYSSYYAQGQEEVGYRDETAFNTNATSIAKYGRKEKVLSMGGLTDGNAQLQRDRYLDLHDYPLLAQRETQERIDRPYAWVRSRGYYWTAEWQVYNQSAWGTRATNTQIEDIVTAECPFFASTDVAATGNSVQRYRDSNQTAWQEILRLVALGTSTNAALQVGVWADRELIVEALPTAPNYRQRGLRYETTEGELVEPWLLRAGRMIRKSDVLPGAAILSTELDDPRNEIIWQVAYNEDQGQATVTPLGARDLAGILMGQLQPFEA